MKKIKTTNQNKYLSDILTSETWIECLEEVSSDIAIDFPRLLINQEQNAVELLIQSRMVSKYLLSNILVDYGRNQVIFKLDKDCLNKVKNILFDWLKDVALVYNEIINLTPEQIMSYAKSNIETRSLLKNNDSQFHTSVMDEFANEYVNMEQLNTSSVKQGNNMNVLKNLVKYGYGLEIEQIAKKFSVLVSNSWSVNYKFFWNEEEEFEYNE